MVHLSDWLPTILAMCGVALPADNLPLDGWDILPVLRGESGKVNTRRFWQWNRYYPYVGSNAAMRDGDWKLVRPRAPQKYRWEIDAPLDRRMREEPGFISEIVPAPSRGDFLRAPAAGRAVQPAHRPGGTTQLGRTGAPARRSHAPRTGKLVRGCRGGPASL